MRPVTNARTSSPNSDPTTLGVASAERACCPNDADRAATRSPTRCGRSMRSAAPVVSIWATETDCRRSGGAAIGRVLTMLDYQFGHIVRAQTS